jgi:DNA replication factor GINS
MNVEELRSVQRTERQKDSLQHLRDSFYRDVADYIADRKAERKQVAADADDPFSSPEVSRLTDEIETAEEVVESIYERRVGKIVKRATFAAAGMAAEDEGLTSEERDLFDDLVARIERNRETVLDTLAGDDDDSDADPDPTVDADATEGPPTETADRVDPDPDPDPDPEPNPIPPTDDAGRAPDPDDLLAEAMGGDAGSADDAAPDALDASSSDRDVPPDEPPADAPPAGASSDASPTPDGGATDAPASDADRTTLRITRDVGEIFGVDEREYDLESEDVVTLPTPNAEPLLARDAAERLDD